MLQNSVRNYVQSYIYTLRQKNFRFQFQHPLCWISLPFFVTNSLNDSSDGIIFVKFFLQIQTISSASTFFAPYWKFAVSWKWRKCIYFCFTEFTGFQKQWFKTIWTESCAYLMLPELINASYHLANKLRSINQALKQSKTK